MKTDRKTASLVITILVAVLSVIVWIVFFFIIYIHNIRKVKHWRSFWNPVFFRFFFGFFFFWRFTFRNMSLLDIQFGKSTFDLITQFNLRLISVRLKVLIFRYEIVNADCQNKNNGMVCPVNCSATNCLSKICNIRNGTCNLGCEPGYQGLACRGDLSLILFNLKLPTTPV